MAKILILYYSTYGHIETMAEAVADGARSTGAEMDIKRVPELVPPEVAASSHFKTDQAAPVAAVADLEQYDAIIVGTPTRYGRMASQMANFLDQTGGLWARGALNGKVGAAFTSTASQHGGQEATLFSIITNLMHLGLIIVGWTTATTGNWRWTRLSAARRTAQPRLPAATGPASHRRRNSMAGATRGAAWLRLPQS